MGMSLWRPKGGKAPYRPDGGKAPWWCDTCPCAAGPAPTECPYDSLDDGPQNLRIVDYADGDITELDCGPCEPSTDPVWPGTFDRYSYCSWSVQTDARVSGKQLQVLKTRINLSTSNDRWDLSIYCKNYDWSSDLWTTMWYGGKDTGDSPVGTYTRQVGCADVPTTLDIEEYTP